MSSDGNPKSYGQQNDSFKTKMEEKKKEKSVNDVMAEAIAGSDSRPRGKWVLAKDTAAPSTKTPEKMEEKNETSILGTAAVVVGVAAGVAMVACGLWNLANYSDPDPGPKNHKEKKKMMKAPGNRPFKIPRDEFEANPRDYFRRQRNQRNR
ncbi:Hypothetical predicted protein [Olea europaea subsp. europaea]|uniref:Uncharacterized protein n=1 Tax=Olea europaea subsp. europaea TaxID=158383 RepID=A0A8S0S4F5_OLEEU|nr:Hypothetical predicted protein [Olea europaea subsp. europaea]